MLACFATETKNLTEVQTELNKLAANYTKMGPQVWVWGPAVWGLDDANGGAAWQARQPAAPFRIPKAAVPKAAAAAPPLSSIAQDAPDLGGAAGDDSSQQQHGPHVAYVDDAAAAKRQLKEIFPTLQCVIADVAHVMRRYGESLTPHHAKTGAARGQGFARGNGLGAGRMDDRSIALTLLNS